MEFLPDDVVLGVMKYLDLPDLFNFRLVCRRLGGLALHRDAWRHRAFGGNLEPRWLCPVLRLAPCLRVLSLELSSEFPASRYTCLLASISTKCAAAELKLYVGFGGEMLAAGALRNQAALGRLKRLSLLLEYTDNQSATPCSPEAVMLLGTVASTSGLQKLSVSNYPEFGPSLDRLALHSTLLAPSLKFFDLSDSGPYSEPFACCILAAHAATLEEVHLDYSLVPTTNLISASLAPLLAALPNLRVLESALLPGLGAVAARRSLRKVTLSVDFEQPFACVASAAALLATAVHLQEVTLYDFSTDDGCVVDLLRALASSRRSSVEVLRLLHDSQPEEPWLGLHTAALLSALPALPALKTLWVDSASDELLLGITPATAPVLQDLKLCPRAEGARPCRHAWLHGDSLKKLLSENPSLRVFLRFHPFIPEYCLEDNPCNVCSLGSRCLRNDNIAKQTFYRCKWILIPRNEFCP